MTDGMLEDREAEVSHDVSGFVAELRRLADALESGATFTIHVDGEDVTVPEGALFSVVHEREGGEVELEFQVTWTVEGSASAEEDATAVNSDATGHAADGHAADAMAEAGPEAASADTDTEEEKKAETATV